MLSVFCAVFVFVAGASTGFAKDLSSETVVRPTPQPPFFPQAEKKGKSPMVSKGGRGAVKRLGGGSQGTGPMRGRAVKNGAVEQMRVILKLPLENRNQVLSQLGDDVFWLLKSMVFSSKESMYTRWSALISLAHTQPAALAKPVILKALKHSEWFLRNAGLLALEHVDADLSLQQADDLLDDPALVVRTAAVDLIQRQKADNYKFRLLEKLNAPDSFHKHSSLWIRAHIVSALAGFAEPGEEPFFTSLLKDPDTRIHPFASKALKKLNHSVQPQNTLLTQAARLK